MKVVLFCGGLGMRLREFSENVPKPMVNIGYRPILWHIMKYYAHFGHRDFIVCLGYKADVIKNYFLNYNEYLSNDFVFSKGGDNLQLLASDIDDWTITFVDTGHTTSIGGRLRAAQPFLGDDEIFLANYSDNLTDLDLSDMLEDFEGRDAVASFLCVKPAHSFHIVELDPGGGVLEIERVAESRLWVNGGYFMFRKELFDYLEDGDELVEDTFGKLIAEGKLRAYRNPGFWASMDTFKERQQLEDMYAQGPAPWEVWRASERPERP